MGIVQDPTYQKVTFPAQEVLAGSDGDPDPHPQHWSRSRTKKDQRPEDQKEGNKCSTVLVVLQKSLLFILLSVNVFQATRKLYIPPEVT